MRFLCYFFDLGLDGNEGNVDFLVQRTWRFLVDELSLIS